MIGKYDYSQEEAKVIEEQAKQLHKNVLDMLLLLHNQSERDYLDKIVDNIEDLRAELKENTCPF